MKKVFEYCALIAIGGFVYTGIEYCRRGYSHWTMFILGGALFVVIGLINEVLPWETPLFWQGVAGAAIVTVAELLAGLVINRWLGMGVWDYSGLPYNVWGQICLSASLLWIPVSILAVVLDDWTRFWLFKEKEERPRYTLF